MKKISLLILTLSLASFSIAQRVADPSLRWSPLSAEELLQTIEIRNSTMPTPPPVGEIINIAEFMPSQGVLITYPLSIPVSSVKQMADIVKVTTIVLNSSAQSQATTTFTNAGVNMNNVNFLVRPFDSKWTRDYGPWFIINGNNQVGIVDFTYNRVGSPWYRIDDNAINTHLATQLGVERFLMPLIHCGGNYMTDGYNISASTTLTLGENSMNQQQILNVSKDYLGLDDYYFIQDPMDDYIHHIDCWGKFLAVDKVLIGQVPTSDYRYNDYEACAQYFKNRLTPWGTKYRVYRVFTPGGSTLSPYTNSLILNDHVFVPMGNNTTNNNNALAVYQEAMPGYTIIPVASPTSPGNEWLNTDGFHCRTHEIADLGMLFVRHYPLFDTLAYQSSYTITADIRPLSGQPLVSDSLLVFYKINDEPEWQTSLFSHTEGSFFNAQLVGLPVDSKISYYIFAKDESQRREKHPYIGAFDPHIFYIREGTGPITHTITASAGTNGTITPSGSVTVSNGLNQTFTFTPNPGYIVDSLWVNSIYVPDSIQTYTFKNVVANHTIFVSFSVENSIKYHKEKDILIYPNPTTGELTIEWTSGQVDEWTSVEIYDIFGRKQKAESRKGKFPSNSLEGWQPQADGVVINISHLNAGIYIIKTTNDSGKLVVKKVVKL